MTEQTFFRFLLLLRFFLHLNQEWKKYGHSMKASMTVIDKRRNLAFRKKILNNSRNFTGKISFSTIIGRTLLNKKNINEKGLIYYMVSEKMK